MQAARQIYSPAVFDIRRPARTKQRSEAKQFDFNKFLWLVLWFGLAAFVHVYQQALVVQNGIDAARLKSSIKEETRVGSGLKVEKMLLQSPSRLERLATADLGMVKPAQVKYIIIRPQQFKASKVAGVGGGPAGLSVVLAKVGQLVR